MAGINVIRPSHTFSHFQSPHFPVLLQQSLDAAPSPRQIKMAVKVNNPPPPYSAKSKPGLWKRLRSFLLAAPKHDSSSEITLLSENSIIESKSNPYTAKKWVKPRKNNGNKVDSRSCLANPKFPYETVHMKQAVRVAFYPDGYHEPAARADAPWRIQLLLYSNNIEQALQQRVLWRGNLDFCWEDKITIGNDPDRKCFHIYRRDIRLAVMSEKPCKWYLTISVWDREAKKLEALSRSEIESHITLANVVHIQGAAATSGEPLEYFDVFYHKNVNLVRGSVIDSTNATTGLQLPSLCEAIDNNIESVITCKS